MTPPDTITDLGARLRHRGVVLRASYAWSTAQWTVEARTWASAERVVVASASAGELGAAFERLLAALDAPTVSP